MYQFTCLAQGLSPAPRVYTKLLKPAFSSLRKTGHTNSAYIDDVLLQSDSKAECHSNVEDTVSLLDSLGLTPHPVPYMYIVWYCRLFAVAVIDVCSPLCAFSWSCLYYYGLCFVLGDHVFPILIKLYKHRRCSSKLFSLITGVVAATFYPFLYSRDSVLVVYCDSSTDSLV